MEELASATTAQAAVDGFVSERTGGNLVASASSSSGHAESIPDPMGEAWTFLIHPERSCVSGCLSPADIQLSSRVNRVWQRLLFAESPRRCAVDQPLSCADSAMVDPPSTVAPEALDVSGVWTSLLDSEVGVLRYFLTADCARESRVVSRAWQHLAFADAPVLLPPAKEDLRATGGLNGAACVELWQRDIGPKRRSTAWNALLLGGITLQERSPQDSYEILCQTTCPFDSAIRRDVARTLPQEELFREKQGKGQTSLFRILRALAIRLWDIGYCQSLNFVVATLIGVFPDDEERAFQCSLALLLRYSLADFYRPKFPKLGVTVWQFDRIVEGFLPKVHHALHRHGVNAEYYALQWFLTLFASDLPQPILRRVWDRFLVAGWQAIVQTGLALLYSVQDELPTLDSCQALRFLKDFARQQRFSSEELLRSAASFQVSHRMLSALEAAHSREGCENVKLFVIKDLNSGALHWTVQCVPEDKSKPAQQLDSDSEDEQLIPIPRAFGVGALEAPIPRRSSRPAAVSLPPDEDPLNTPGQTTGPASPFMIRNLDTGETKVMQKAFNQFVNETDAVVRSEQATNNNTSSIADLVQRSFSGLVDMFPRPPAVQP